MKIMAIKFILKKKDNDKPIIQYSNLDYYYEEERSNYDIPCNKKGDEIDLTNFYTLDYIQTYLLK